MSEKLVGQLMRGPQHFTVFIMSFALVSCSDQSSEQSIYLPKDLHSSKREIAITAEYDAQVRAKSARLDLDAERLAMFRDLFLQRYQLRT